MTSWFFIEMAAKSALICSLALLLAMVLRRRAAADRALVLRVGVGLLLALPLIDFAFPVLQIEAFAAPAAPAMSLSQAEMAQLLALAETLPPVETSIWSDPTPLVLILWGAGALAVLARLLAGLFTLRRWTRKAEPVTDPVWLAALERAKVASGAPDRLRLLVADGVPGPLGWGWVRPVVLIDHDTLAEPEEADAILAHEVAHVARRDWPALMLTRLATALFWFNPLTWTLAREAVQQAEEAADAHAARLVEPTRYAETLLSWGQIGRGIAVPANSIAPGARALARRVKAVLEPRLVERSAGSRLAMVAILLSVGVAAPVAALELVEAARPPQPAAAPIAPLAAAAVTQPPAPGTPARPARPEAPPAAVDVSDLPELRQLEEIGPAMERLREALPRMREMREMRRIGREELARMLAEGKRFQRVPVTALHEALERARTHLPSPEMIERYLPRADLAEADARMRAAMPNARALQEQMRVARAARAQGMEQGARGMEQGARGMEQGAAQMEASARRFRDPQERERIIARERERGRTVTHQELIDAAEGMEEGARGMRQGAEQMRRAARDMVRNP